MKTKMFKKNQLLMIRECLDAGGVVAFPTDTVFGVGVRHEEVALQKLKAAKLRDTNKPIPLMVQNLAQIEQLAYVDERAKKLIDYFMPGALTLVLKKREQLPAYLSDGLDTIAVRMPKDAFVLSLLTSPMFVTSANLSGQLPGKDEVAVLAQLDGRIDGIVEGEAKADVPSTIVDVSKDEVKMLRIGAISQAAIEKVLGG